jgi:hypothetical protein
MLLIRRVPTVRNRAAAWRPERARDGRRRFAP